MQKNKENLKIKAQELVLSFKKEKKAFCDTFIYEPENVQEQSLGNLYIVGNISNELSENSSYLVNLLASIVKKEYYANFKRTPFEALESSLYKANMTLADFTESGNSSWIGNLDMIVAAWNEETLHFSLTGRIKAFLIRDDKITDIGQGLSKKEEKPHPFKTFANIATGSLEENDKIIFATPEIIRHFSLQTLKNIFSIETNKEALRKIEDFFQKEKIKENLGILTLETKKEILHREEIALRQIKIEPEKEIEEETIERIETNNQTQEDEIKKDEKKLTLENILGYRPDEKQENGFEEEISNEENQEYEIKQTKKEITFSKISSIAHIFRVKLGMIKEKLKNAVLIVVKFTKIKLVPAISLALKKFFSVFKKALKTITIRKSTATLEVEKPALAKNEIFERSQHLQKIKTKWNSFPFSSRLLLSTSLILIILFAGSLMLLSQKKSHEINLTRYSEILTQANQKEDEAEAALIYQDETKARKNLKESRELLGEIFGSDYLQEEAKELEAKIQEQLKKLDRIVEISEPKIIYDFKNLKSEIEVKGILNLNNLLFSYNSSNNAVYKYDLAENVGLNIETDSNGLGRLQKAAVLSDGRFIFYTDSPGLAIFNPNQDELKKIDAFLPKEISSENLKDISSYGTNVYLLDAYNDQIWKHTAILGGFSKSRAWIKPNEESDFSQCVSLAIDGAIYILKQDGTILKYLSGYKKEFAGLSEITQPIEQATKIYTLPGYANLYILEPKNKRVLIFDKQGKIVRQYFSDRFNDLKDLVVLEKEKKIYLLNGTEIVEIGMEN